MRRLTAAVAALALLPVNALAQEFTNAQMYERACAACHGNDGTGRSQQDVAFETPLPDFSDCEFASREPDPDWFAVIHEGGPVRAFDKMMPAFGDALSADEINQILAHVRTFCADDEWPRGEFNLPRPLYTEKAFPEDESVFTLGVSETATTFEALYEKRFGPRSMWEVKLPLISRDSVSGSGTDSGIGDVVFGLKHTLYHNLNTGNIFSVGIEAQLPTGDEDDGFGKGAVFVEPFVAYAKLLPSDSFLQIHAFGEFATGDSLAEDELAFRATIGRTWTTGGPFGRAWSPMLEGLVTHELGTGGDTNFDLVPQVQVALNQRQHILLNAGVRIPANNTTGRDPVYTVYLLWDWFDGGFLDGW